MGKSQPVSMHTIGYLKYLFLSSLFTLGKLGKVKVCPIESNPIKLPDVPGNLTAGSGWKNNDKCEWTLSPPSDGDHYKLRITITSASCKDKFKIKGKPYCDIITPYTLYYVENESSDVCEPCTESHCFTYSKPLTIEMEYERNLEGFTLNYQFETCTKSTPAPTENVTVATVEPSTKQADDTTSISTTLSLTRDVVISTVRPSVKPSYDPTSVSSFQNNTESLSKDTPSSVSTPPSDSSIGLLISIFVPLVIIFAIAVVVLIIIIRIRTNKATSQSDADENPNDGVYASIDNHAQSTATAFGNQAYQTVISASVGDPYAVIDDGTVYYSGVGEDQSANHQPPNAYEQVTLDVEVNEYDHVAGDTLNRPQNYDEVTLEVERQSTDEALDVNNVLYEDSRRSM